MPNEKTVFHIAACRLLVSQDETLTGAEDILREFNAELERGNAAWSAARPASLYENPGKKYSESDFYKVADGGNRVLVLRAYYPNAVVPCVFVDRPAADETREKGKRTSAPEETDEIYREIIGLYQERERSYGEMIRYLYYSHDEYHRKLLHAASRASKGKKTEQEVVNCAKGVFQPLKYVSELSPRLIGLYLKEASYGKGETRVFHHAELKGTGSRSPSARIQFYEKKAADMGIDLSLFE